MNKRPLTITVIGWIYVAVGTISLVVHMLPLFEGAAAAPGAESAAGRPLDPVVASGSAILALVGGAFLLRGRNWARWLCVAWMGFHVVLSLVHSTLELVIHGLLFAAVLLLLWRPGATAYFRIAGRAALVKRES